MGLVGAREGKAEKRAVMKQNEIKPNKTKQKEY